MRGANSVSKSDSVRGRSYGLCEIYVAQTLTFSASCNSKINDTPIWKMKPRLGEEKKKKGVSRWVELEVGQSFWPEPGSGLES